MAATAARWQGEGAESGQEGEGEIKHLADSREWNEGVKETRVSAPRCSAVAESDREQRGAGQEGAGGSREAETQAKRLMWITVGQTSEEDKTANMSHCSLLAFNNRCLGSSVSGNASRPGCFDPMSVYIYINIKHFPPSATVR